MQYTIGYNIHSLILRQKGTDKPSRPTRTNHDVGQKNLKLQKRVNRSINENCITIYVNLVSQTDAESPKLTCMQYI